MRLRHRHGRAPDFIGIGAEGAGAAWWQAALVAHPEISGPRGPLHFFDPFCVREMTEADVAKYHASFSAQPKVMRGEWTPRYLADAWVPPLLRRVAPEAKLLVMLADPIERCRIEHARREAETRRLLRRHRRRTFATDVLDRSCHASQLARLRRFVDHGRLLVLQYERCRLQPAKEYARTLRFLGVRDDVVSRRLRRMPRTASPAPLRPHLEASLRAVLDEEVDALIATVPGFDVSLWPNFR